MLYLALKFFSVPVPVPELFCKYLTRPVPKSKPLPVRPNPLDIPFESFDPQGAPLDSPLDPQTKPDYQETKNFCTVYPWSCFKATVHFTSRTLGLFKVASSFWMWIFTKLGTGKGPAVVDHQPGQVHKVSYYSHQFLQGLQDPE